MANYVLSTDHLGVIQPIAAGSKSERYFSSGDSLDLSNPLPASWLEVDLSQLSRNYRNIKDLVGKETGIIAVVKSDAYGHGLVVVAQELEAAGADIIGVADAIDARTLRSHNLNGRILAIYPPPYSQIKSLVMDRIDITVTTLEAAQQAERIAAKLQCVARLHLQLETGMHYYGAEGDEAIRIGKYIAGSPQLDLAGVSTHYAAAESSYDFTDQQHQKFLGALRRLAASGVQPSWVHSASSSAMDRFPASWDAATYHSIFPKIKVLVRPGCALYGTYTASNLPLSTQFVATKFITHISEIKHVPAASYIGYFRKYRTKTPKTIGILPIGWGSNGLSIKSASVLINGESAPILGLISANTCAIDLAGHEVRIGQRVVLFDHSSGSGLSLHDLAANSDTFVNFVVRQLGAFSTRVYTRK